MSKVYTPTEQDIRDLRKEQKERLDARGRAMRELWTAELDNDGRLLKKPWEGPNALSPGSNPFDVDGERWFPLGTIFNDYRPNILEEISKYAMKRLDGEAIIEVESTLNENDWKYNRDWIFSGANTDIHPIPLDENVDAVRTILEDTGYVGDVEVELPDALPWFIEEWQDDNESDAPDRQQWKDTQTNEVFNEKEQLPEVTLKNIYDTERIWEPIHCIWELMGDLRKMGRFADARNPELTAKPLPDGSNIPPQSVTLIHAWVLHRAWIRLLHYRTLIFGQKWVGWQELKRIEQLSLALYRIELMDVDRSARASEDNPRALRQITEVYDHLFECLQVLGRFIKSETRDDGNSYSESETYLYNLHPSRLRPFMNNTILPSLATDLTYKLWSTLLYHSGDFNQRSDLLHVEDVLVSNRVVVHDEWYMVNENLQKRYDPDEQIMLAAPGTEMKTEEDIVMMRLRRVSEINRLRRNKLLMTSWSDSRPWKQLYVMLDTSGAKKLIGDRIDKFWIRMEFIELNNPNPPPKNPSNKANIFRHLFPIHPISSRDPDSATRQRRLGKYYDGKCGICFDNFTEEMDKILSRLHCDHWFHFTCIQRWNDNPDKLSFRCSTCRVDWRLYEAAGITPETRATDVWDFEDVLGEEAVDPSPNVTRYYEAEVERRNHSALWRDTTGYPGGARTGSGLRRTPTTEMAVYREMRRERSNTARRKHEAARSGFYGLDPDDLT